MRVNRTAVAEIFGKSVSTIDQWVSSGCPVIKRGGKGIEWAFDTAAVHEWCVQRRLAAAEKKRPIGLDEARLRKLAADAELAELELAKKRSEVVAVDVVTQVWGGLCAEARIRFRNIPVRVVSALVGETDEREIKAALLREIDLVLTDMADLDPVNLVSDESPNSYEAD